MKHSMYLRYDIIRTMRNRRVLIFSLAFPLVLFLIIGGTNRHAHVEGIAFPTYYMTGMVAWGTIIAVVSTGARIAAERQIGWSRQLRITPLPTSVYFRAKVVSAYISAALSIIVLYLAGTVLGVRLSAGQWLTMTGLLLIGLVPFVVLGVLLGHLLSVDSMGPAMGGITALFALLGGAWGPLATSGTLVTIVKGIPSYWLVQASRTAVHGSGWPLEAWLVLAIWTAALARLAIYVYKRDTARA